mgnify:CR=1 FL=1
MILRVSLALTSRELATAIAEQLSDMDHVFEVISADVSTWGRLVQRGADIIILDQELVPEPVENSMATLNGLPESPTTVVLAHSESPDDHARLLESNCDTVLYAGLPLERLVGAIEAAILTRSQLSQISFASRFPGRAEEPSLMDFRSNAASMQAFMQTVRRIVNSGVSLLIRGETGVGKEHLARAIHNAGPLRAGPFIAVNIAAIPEQLLESELFGHEAGSFTGADRSRRGAFELAHGGTLFLDEIGDMPLHLQAKLLRVLQDFEIRRVGSESTVQVDVRMMTATNRDIEAEVNANQFRQDLYYRLGVIHLTVPPLRERAEDIPMLARESLERLSIRVNSPACRISEEAMTCLEAYDWPGNTRELINVLERALLLSDTEEVRPECLPASIAGRIEFVRESAVQLETAPSEWHGQTLPQVRESMIEKIEKAYLRMVLKQAKGRVGRAAELAGIHPRGLYDKLKQYQLKKEDYRG